MNKYDMSEFLSVFTECCTHDEVDKATNHDKLRGVQHALKKFAVEYKKEILELFPYSEREGKYTFVVVQNLVQMMDAYEEYHNDMVRFITSLQSIRNERVDNLDKFLGLMKQAEEADQNFLNKTINAPEVKMVVPEALKNVELMVRLVTFIDEVLDNFIKYSGENEEVDSERVKVTVAFYKHSTEIFITTIATKFFDAMSKLIAVKDGRKDLIPISGDFKLI
jgi:hypothetical protein